jgi:c-di-GMP-binding flagellar brake protein YcgR
MDALVDLYTTDLSLGGMYVETDQVLRVGSALTTEIVHPDTGEVFELECVVRRCEGGPQPGLGVEFVNLDEVQKQQLQAFVSNAIPVVIVDPE